MPKKKTLDEFVRDARLQKCKVCALPPDVLKQIRERSRERCPIDIVVAWIKSEYGVTVKPSDFRAHQRGAHEPGSTRAARS